MGTHLAALLAAGSDLLLGAACAGCGQPGAVRCAACREVLTALRPAVRWPEPAPEGLPVPFSAGAYESPLRGMIVAHKEDQALALTTVLGRLLAGAVTALLDELLVVDGGGRAGLDVALVPVPSAPATVRRRGFDATRALARSAARVVRRDHPGVRVLAAVRHRVRVRDQAGLTTAERAANLQGAMVVRDRAPPAYAIVVDDVITTGASLTEAARALRQAGVTVLGAAVVAASRRRLREAGTGLSRD